MEEKTTDDLSQELMSKDDIDSYIKENRFYFSDRSISELLNTLYDKKDISKASLARKAGMSEVYQMCIRDRVPADRRSSVVSLTEQGERLKPVFQSVCRQLQETQYRGLSQEEIVQLRRMLAVVAENFSAYSREDEIQNV